MMAELSEASALQDNTFIALVDSVNKVDTLPMILVTSGVLGLW